MLILILNEIRQGTEIQAMSYSDWNDQLLRYFFGSFTSGERVRVTLTNEILDSEFEGLGGVASFKKALIHGPEWPADMSAGHSKMSSSLAAVCRGLHRQWNLNDRRHQNYQPAYGAFDGPPYFNYLCAFCLAWTQEAENLNDSNFYDRLELIYPGHSLNQAMGTLSDLWKGLETWTNLHEGQLGLFETEILGHHAHVGIPKSQVILTPGKIEKTPELFYDLSLSPDEPLDVLKLREKILKDFDEQDFLLGKYLFNEVRDKSDLGRSALSQLLEHFEVWDGHAPIRTHQASAELGLGPAVQAREATIVVGLEFLPDQQRWRPVLKALIPELSDGDLTLKIGEAIFRSRLTSCVGSPFVAENDQSQNLHLADINESPFVVMAWQNEHEGEREIIASVPKPQRIQCFDWTSDGRFLLQKASLPSEGSVYALVNESVTENFAVWCEKAGVAVGPPLPQEGLGSDERLHYIDKIGNANAHDWSMFPDGGDDKRRRPRRLTLVGGSRQRREKAARTYLPFDPPTLRLEAEGDISFECKNCTCEEIVCSADSLPDWVHRTAATRLFEINMEPDVHRVSIEAKRGGETVGKVAFRVLNREAFEPIAIESYKVNQFGNTEGNEFEAGVCGVTAPANFDFSFDEGPFHTWCSDSPDIDRAPYMLLDWLATQRTASFSRMKSFCTRRLYNATQKTDIAEETKALLNLGHIEIQLDDRGRWSYVHATRPTLYPLPSLADGMMQFILTGGYTSELANRVERECAATPALSYDRHPQLGGNIRGYQLIPDRIAVFAEDPNEVENLGRSLGIKVCDSPPSWEIANWCGTLDSWYDQLHWHIGGMNYADASYKPPFYRTRSPQKWPEWDTGVPVNCNLVRTPDPQTKKHFNYALVKKEEDEFFYALCGHKAWGTWFMHRHMLMARFGDILTEGIPIAYEPIERLLIVPLELDPPPLFSKALSLCSGFAPRRVSPKEYPAYLNKDFGFNYDGPCIAYQSVPAMLADVLLKKLGSKPQDFRNSLC